MARSKQILVGDRVAYAAAWLRSIGCYSGDLPQARGTVTALQAIGKQQLVAVQWDQPDLPAKVLACNLALVGTEYEVLQLLSSVSFPVSTEFQVMDVSSFLGGNFLTHLDLPQPYQIWTITRADQQLVGTDQKICLTFSEFPSKPLGLNKTNLRRVAELYTTNGSAWAGRQLLVYRSTTTFQGASRQCVRVCGPQQAPPDPTCNPQGIAVMYQPPAAAAVPQPVAAPAPQPAPAPAPQPVPAPAPAPQAVAAQAPAAPAAPPQQPAQPQADQAPWEQSQQQPQQNSPPSA